MGGKTREIGRIVVAVVLLVGGREAPRAAAIGSETKNAFTSPAIVFPMPTDWIKKPVVYDEWAKDADLAVALEQDVYQIINPLIQQYAHEKRLKIAVREGTCGITAGLLSRKAIDIGGFCCPAGTEDRFPGLRFHTLGIVGKAFLVNKRNPIDNLTTDQLKDIFRGKIYHWSEIKTRDGNPGPDWAVFTVGRLHCQARPGHWRLLLDNDNLFSPRMFEVGTIPDMIAKVAKTREAVGWEVLSMVEKHQMTDSVKPLKINGWRPNDIEALATGRYPYYRVYNLTTWEGVGLANPEAALLVDYLKSALIEADFSRLGIVPAGRLKKTGWKFVIDELAGEPEQATGR